MKQNLTISNLIILLRLKTNPFTLQYGLDPYTIAETERLTSLWGNVKNAPYGSSLLLTAHLQEREHGNLNPSDGASVWGR